MNNLKILQAMLLLAETLNYSSTYKKQLYVEINNMIEFEDTNNNFLL